jgi:hypothetical protein
MGFSAPDVNARRAVFQDIFAHVAQVGVDPKSLTLAWDFTTGSRASITQRAVFMRDDAASRFPATGPTYYIDSVQENVSSTTGRVIKGKFLVPWYAVAGGKRVRDACMGRAGACACTHWRVSVETCGLMCAACAYACIPALCM